MFCGVGSCPFFIFLNRFVFFKEKSSLSDSRMRIMVVVEQLLCSVTPALFVVLVVRSSSSLLGWTSYHGNGKLQKGKIRNKKRR